jgi:hypothetical protein
MVKRSFAAIKSAHGKAVDKLIEYSDVAAIGLSPVLFSISSAIAPANSTNVFLYCLGFGGKVFAVLLMVSGIVALGMRISNFKLSKQA